MAEKLKGTKILDKFKHLSNDKTLTFYQNHKFQPHGGTRAKVRGSQVSEIHRLGP